MPCACRELEGARQETQQSQEDKAKAEEELNSFQKIAGEAEAKIQEADSLD